jgi:hypothetical protein
MKSLRDAIVKVSFATDLEPMHIITLESFCFPKLHQPRFAASLPAIRGESWLMQFRETKALKCNNMHGLQVSCEGVSSIYDRRVGHAAAGRRRMMAGSIIRGVGEVEHATPEQILAHPDFAAARRVFVSELG